MRKRSSITLTITFLFLLVFLNAHAFNIQIDSIIMNTPGGSHQTEFIVGDTVEVTVEYTLFMDPYTPLENQDLTAHVSAYCYSNYTTPTFSDGKDHIYNYSNPPPPTLSDSIMFDPFTLTGPSDPSLIEVHVAVDMYMDHQAIVDQAGTEDTSPITVSTDIPVPEPSTLLLLGAGLAGLGVFSRRRFKRF